MLLWSAKPFSDNMATEARSTSTDHVLQLFCLVVFFRLLGSLGHISNRKIANLIELNF